MLDVMGALRTMLLATTPVSDLVGTRIWVNRLPRDVIEAQDPDHPAKMLVVRQAGGFGKRDFLAVDQSRFNVLCYGEDDHEADAVRRAAWSRLEDLRREEHDGVLLHHINPAGGPVSLVDPDIVWPAVSQGFTILADVKE